MFTQVTTQFVEMTTQFAERLSFLTLLSTAYCTVRSEDCADPSRGSIDGNWHRVLPHIEYNRSDVSIHRFGLVAIRIALRLMLR